MFIFISILVVIGLLGAFIWMMWLVIYAMIKKPTTCPACGRKIRIVEKSVQCYKCKTKLFKHANGEYMIRS